MKNEMLAKCGLTPAPWRRGILIFVMSLGLAVWPLTLAAQSVTLAWNPSPSTNVAGYMLYYGTDGINFDSQMDAGTNTTWTVTGLKPGSTNYFEVVAYDANDDLSPPSNQIEYTVPNAAQTVTVLANPANAGGVTGGGSFAAGSSVTVTATANSGYTFANWTENGTRAKHIAQLQLCPGHQLNLVANFTANPAFNYTIAVSASPSAGGTVSGGGTFASGSSQTVTATANSGYTFTNWTVNGSVVSSSSSYTFTVTGNQTLVANFTANPVTLHHCGERVAQRRGHGQRRRHVCLGSSQTVTATANSGYTFTNWTVNGSVVSSSSSYTFTVTGNQTLVANFTANPVTYTVATQINPAKAGSVTGGGAFAAGTSLTVTATANSGYTFTNWTENGIVQSASPNYSFTLATNRNLIANFTTISVTTNATTNSVTYTVTSSAGNNGSISPNGPQTVATGGNITFTAAPASGYQVNQWLVNGTVVQTGGSSYSITKRHDQQCRGRNLQRQPGRCHQQRRAGNGPDQCQHQLHSPHQRQWNPCPQSHRQGVARQARNTPSLPCRQRLGVCRLGKQWHCGGDHPQVHFLRGIQCGVAGRFHPQPLHPRRGQPTTVCSTSPTTRLKKVPAPLLPP